MKILKKPNKLIYLAIVQRIDYYIVKSRWIIMPNIKPVSDLRNYTEVLNEVNKGNEVINLYLSSEVFQKNLL